MEIEQSGEVASSLQFIGANRKMVNEDRVREVASQVRDFMFKLDQAKSVDSRAEEILARVAGASF
jgi:hypothetical protein